MAMLPAARRRALMFNFGGARRMMVIGPDDRRHRSAFRGLTAAIEFWPTTRRRVTPRDEMKMQWRKVMRESLRCPSFRVNGFFSSVQGR